MTIVNMVGGGGGVAVKKFPIKWSVSSFKRSTTYSPTSSTTYAEFVNGTPSEATFTGVKTPESSFIKGSITELSKTWYLKSSKSYDEMALDETTVNSLVTSLSEICGFLKPTVDNPLITYLRPFKEGSYFYQGMYYVRGYMNNPTVEVRLYYEEGELKTTYPTDSVKMYYALVSEYSTSASFKLSEYNGWYLMGLDMVS